MDSNSPSGCHELPVAILVLVRIVRSVLGLAVLPVPVGPVVLVVIGMLGGAVVRIVHRFDAADVIVKLVARASTGRAASAART